jgi:predicted nuclease with TOPRIM domain
MVFVPFVKEMYEFKNEVNTRLELLENNDKKIFDILERNNIRFEKIEERLEKLEKNNIK